MRLVIDSSIWIEFFADGPKAGQAEKYIKSQRKIFLPSVVAYEVYKKIKLERGEQLAVLALAQMEGMCEELISIDQGVAIKAADLAIVHKLPMADANIYAVAQIHDAKVVTMDAHFNGLPGVEYIG